MKENKDKSKSKSSDYDLKFLFCWTPVLLFITFDGL